MKKAPNIDKHLHTDYQFLKHVITFISKYKANDDKIIVNQLSLHKS